jgi:O-antigen/teichoic acid export membrane protein
MISLVNLTDFGFKNSLVRYVAANLDRKEEIGRYFNTAFWIYLLLSLGFIALTVLFLDEIVSHILRVPAEYYRETSFVITISAVSFGLRFLASPYQSVIEGFQEHFYSQLVLIAWLVVNSGASLAVLALKPSIYALGAVSIASNLMVVAFFILRVRRRFPFARLNPKHFDRAAAFNLFRFGVGIQIATLMIALREPIYKILIPRTGDLESLASFEISYKLCTQLVSMVISPLLGTFAVSALLCNRREELEGILRLIVGFTLTVFIPAGLFIGSFSPQLISLWLGHEADQTAMEVIIIFAAFAVYYATEPLYKAIEGSGGSSYSASVQTFSIIVSIAAFILLAPLGRLKIPCSLLFGFTAFSISNYFVFRHRFRGMVLLRQGQIILLLSPAIVYALIALSLPPRWLPALFLFYIAVQLTVSLKAKVFDFIGFGGKVFSVWRGQANSSGIQIR